MQACKHPYNTPDRGAWGRRAGAGRGRIVEDAPSSRRRGKNLPLMVHAHDTSYNVNVHIYMLLYRTFVCTSAVPPHRDRPYVLCGNWNL